MKKVRQTVVSEICIVLVIFLVTMLPFANFIGILALFVVTFALILLLLRVNKRRHEAAMRGRSAELIDASSQQNDHSSQH